MDTQQSNRFSNDGLYSLGKTLSVVSVCLDAGTSAELKHFVASTPLVKFQGELRNYLSSAQGVPPEWLEEPTPDICLVDFDKNRGSAIQTVERIHECLPNAAIFAVSEHSQPEDILEAMRCHCSEYMTKPMEADRLLEAAARVRGKKKETREQSAKQVFGFFGTKGGVGVTTIAAHLGTFLAKSCARRTLLIDLHPTLGDAALYLGLTKYQYDFYGLADSSDRLDADLMQSFVLHHSSGLDILPAPSGGETSRRVSSEAIAETLEFVSHRYEFVLVDCPPGLDEQNLEVLPHLDKLFLVTVAEVSAQRNLARCLDCFGRIEVPPEKVKVVLNRYHKKSPISQE